MTLPANRHARRKAASKARKGKTIKSLSPAALRVAAARIMSKTQLASVTQSVQPLRGDDAAALGRRFAELMSAIAVLPEGGAEQQELVVERIAVVNTLLNGGRYDDTVQRRIDYLMKGEPGPVRPVEPNDTSPVAEHWRSADTRYYEQTALVRGLIEACAPVLGRTRAFGFALELLHQRDGYPLKMLLPAQRRSSTSDDHYRSTLKCMAVQRRVFDAAVEGVPRNEILRRANGQTGADLIDDKTFENWVEDTDNSDIKLAAQLGLAIRNGTVALLPPELQIRLLQLQEMTFPEWVRSALAAR